MRLLIVMFRYGFFSTSTHFIEDVSVKFFICIIMKLGYDVGFLVNESIYVEFDVACHAITIIVHPVATIRDKLPLDLSYTVVEMPYE